MVTRYVDVVLGSRNPQVFEFKSDLEDIKSGDTVVCATRGSFTVGVVQTVKSQADWHDGEHSWVIQKIDMEGHNKKMERIKTAEELEAAMQLRLQESAKLKKFQMLADAGDEVMADLLKRYKDLDI